jgi:hypothetical protein
MASLLTAAEKTLFKSALDNLFDTFKQDIVVYKEAQISLINESQPRMFGYNERVDISNINYVPVTGVFPALVSFGKKQDENQIEILANRITEGQASIKVKSDCRDFIDNNGRTIGVSINDLMFKVVSSQSQRRYITPDYFIYILEREK